MSINRAEADDQEPTDSSTAPPIRGGDQDATGLPNATGSDDRTDAEREAADFGGD